MKSNKNKGLRILFIGKADDFYSKQAGEFIRAHFPESKIIFSARQDPFPEKLFDWEGDIILSYLSQWIIPGSVLQKAGMAALNFHPGPPEYPGIGCTNFAVYDGANEFGITCHHMLSKVDTGDIIAVKRFPVYESDTVFTITQRCYSYIINLFYEIFYLLMNGKALPVSDEQWKRKPYLRKELNEICKLTPEMGLKEIERRIKATTYTEPWALLHVKDQVIKLTTEDVHKKTYVKFINSQ